MKEDPKKINEKKPADTFITKQDNEDLEKPLEQTGLGEDPEMRKIHDANLDDSFDRAESELDD